jgi:hypothetical protein
MVSILAPGTTLDRGQYLLLEIESVQQWGPAFIETRWRAQEVEPETRRQRYVTIADVALPTYAQRQIVSQAARRALMASDPPVLLNAFLEQEHCFFVFANEPGRTLQQRIDHYQLLREEEAMRCLQDLTRTLVGLSHLNPPAMHGWICPAHLVQRGEHWQVRPGSVLVAGEAARFRLRRSHRGNASSRERSWLATAGPFGVSLFRGPPGTRATSRFSDPGRGVGTHW